jgi:VanZ family protein
MRTDRVYAVAVALYCAGIFALSHRPVPPQLARFAFEGADKLAHMGIYAGLATLVALGLRAAPRRYSPRVLWLAPLCFATAYGATDELHQGLIDGRTAEIADLAADFTGALLAQALLCGALWRIPAPWAHGRAS